MSIFNKMRWNTRKKPIGEVHHVAYNEDEGIKIGYHLTGGFTMMKPPTEEDYKKFKNVNIADMYLSTTLLRIINKIEA